MKDKKFKQRLLVDKVTFTFPIDKDKRLPLLDRINEPEFHEKYNWKVYPNNPRNRYKNNYQFTIYKGNTIELSMYPRNKAHNFLRVEYNPALLGVTSRSIQGDSSLPI